MALVKCPCALRLRRVAQNVRFISGAWHLFPKFLHQIALVTSQCAFDCLYRNLAERPLIGSVFGLERSCQETFYGDPCQQSSCKDLVQQSCQETSYGDSCQQSSYRDCQETSCGDLVQRLGERSRGLAQRSCDRGFVPLEPSERCTDAAQGTHIADHPEHVPLRMLFGLVFTFQDLGKAMISSPRDIYV